MEKANQQSIIIAAIILGAMLLIGIFGGAYLFTDNDSPIVQDDRLIIVTGEGESEAAPDTAILQVIVTTKLTEGPQESQDKNADITQKVIDNIKVLDIPDEDIKTSEYYMRKSFDRVQEFDGWVTTHRLSVTVPIEKAPSVLSNAVVGDEVTFPSGSLIIENDVDIKEAARKKALENAQKKAEEIAAQSGLKLGEIKDITEGDTRGAGYPIASERGGGGGAVEIQPGTYKMTTDITVAYEVN
ncbi:SIMPL domain-containing protein [Patescibacteria group bacterium]|nr:SIMPL domain-containing protein [Patescibacteria group bacterium]MBU1673095.1 SIMPL domain-containing protein [Patescibacteria group bacterium]MBU1963376.1 SIMPL domain-containing protein [Patescibacteria group bacterium]